MRRKTIQPRSLPNRPMRDVVACMISPVATAVFILGAFDTSPLLRFEGLVFTLSMFAPIWLSRTIIRVIRRNNNRSIRDRSGQ